MRRNADVTAPILLLLCLGPGVVFAQESSPPAPTDAAETQPRVKSCVQIGADQAGSILYDAAIAHVASELAVERAVQTSKQVGAPSATGASSSPVNGAESPSLLALAVENNLISSEEGALTVDLNAFAFRALADPTLLDDPRRYAKEAEWRRWTGALTLGGKGDAFDRDGDGNVDDALDAEELTDIINLELRYRWLGTRDPRDQKNFQKLLNEVSPESTQRNALAARLHARLHEFIKQKYGKSPDSICEQDVEAFLKSREFESTSSNLLGEYGRSELALRDKLESFEKDVARELVVTLVAGLKEQKEQFGADRAWFGIRGSRGGAESSLNFNLDYTRTKAVAQIRKHDMYKAGLEFKKRFFEDAVGRGENRGIRASVAAAYEMYDDVPDVTHDTIARVNLKLEFPINDVITLPISVTWSNHADLITDEEEVRGHIGFTIDFEGALDFGKKEE